MASANINGTAVTYRYNSDGLRSYKKVGTTEHEYQYLEDKLVYEKNGNLQFHYRYDAFGNLAEIRRVNADGSVNMACAVCNSFGDVIELRYRSGGLYATYKYDTWGKLLGVYDASGNEITSIYSLATQNPFRYRGYYYDTESGLYYLNGRYYDPVVCRFISPDSVSVATASLSSYYNKNLYAYCDNNPVIRKDTTGAYWETALDVVSLGASIFEVSINPSDPWAWAGLAGDFFDVVAPCIGGIGEAVRVAKASMKGADAAVDAVSAAKKADNAVDGVSNILRKTNYYVTPNGECIPAQLTEFNNNLSKLDNQNGKYIGLDNKGAIRIRVNEIHQNNPGFIGKTNPLHTVPHFHIDRRTNGITGKWNKVFTGPMEALY